MEEVGVFPMTDSIVDPAPSLVPYRKRQPDPKDNRSPWGGSVDIYQIPPTKVYEYVLRITSTSTCSSCRGTRG